MEGTPPVEHQLSEPWMDDAACKGKDPNIFFPERGEDARPAKLICSECVVKQECLEYALGEQNSHLPGIWGGTSARERRYIRTRRGRRLVS